MLFIPQHLVCTQQTIAEGRIRQQSFLALSKYLQREGCRHKKGRIVKKGCMSVMYPLCPVNPYPVAGPDHFAFLPSRSKAFFISHLSLKPLYYDLFPLCYDLCCSPHLLSDYSLSTLAANVFLICHTLPSVSLNWISSPTSLLLLFCSNHSPRFQCDSPKAPPGYTSTHHLSTMNRIKSRFF